MKRILKLFSDIKWFLLCMLRGNCVYSIKKFLTYLFSFLVIYLAIFTDKSYIELLGFIAVLLGIRSYDKLKYQAKPEENKTNSTENLG